MRKTMSNTSRGPFVVLLEWLAFRISSSCRSAIKSLRHNSLIFTVHTCDCDCGRVYVYNTVYVRVCLAHKHLYTLSVIHKSFKGPNNTFLLVCLFRGFRIVFNAQICVKSVNKIKKNREKNSLVSNTITDHAIKIASTSHVYVPSSGFIFFLSTNQCWMYYSFIIFIAFPKMAGLVIEIRLKTGGRRIQKWTKTS